MEHMRVIFSKKTIVLENVGIFMAKFNKLAARESSPAIVLAPQISNLSAKYSEQLFRHSNAVVCAP